MTAKRFTMIYFETDGNLIFDETKHDGEWYDSTECLQDDEIVTLLNAQDMQIFLLKCVIQTITAESMDKNISHKRILEIKKHWYDKLYGGVE